jgi:23S rRNA C2498 (ribose-2'-O)-methylase RlmM
MVEEPSRVIKLINIWLHNRLCRYAVVNLKYGYADPFTVLTQVRGPDGCIPLATQCICRHLYHDRDEFTIMIKV